MIELDKIPFVRAKHYHKGRVKRVELVVIHSAEAKELPGTAENVARYFATTDRAASAHYCVDRDSAVQCVWDRDTAFAAKNANSNGVHIELAGYARQTEAEWLDEYGIAMLDNAAQIAAYLCRKFIIPVQRAIFAGNNDPRVLIGGLAGHRDVPLHGSHTDPGPNFVWDFFLERVRGFYAGMKASD